MVSTPLLALSAALLLWVIAWALVARASRAPLARADALRDGERWRRRVLLQRTVAVIYIPATFVAVCAAVSPLLVPVAAEPLLVDPNRRHNSWDDEGWTRYRAALHQAVEVAVHSDAEASYGLESSAMNDVGGFGSVGDLLSGIAVDLFGTTRFRGLIAFAVFARLAPFATLTACILAGIWFRRAVRAIPARDDGDPGGVVDGVSAPATPTAAFRAQR
jgi:hypothetical protein